MKSAIDRRNESGKNEQGRVMMLVFSLIQLLDYNTLHDTPVPLTPQIDDAVKMYEKTELFMFMHCWKLLRSEAKWNDRLLELNTSGAAVKASKTSQNPDTETQSGPENGDEPRPEGRDSAKRKRSRGAGDAGSSSTAVEVLQQLNERNEKSEVKQEKQMEEILNLKGNKMKLGEKMYDLHRQDMEVRTKLKEEQSLTKKDIEVREKQSEAQLLTAEVGIMGADLGKLSPQVRLYYVAMQRQILERRGIHLPPNNDS
jgi:hypothetical protein